MTAMKRALRLIFAITCLVIILWISGVHDCLALIANASWSAMGVVVLAVTLDRMLMAYKWVRLLQARRSSLPLIKATQIYCASMVWGLLLPATLGADAIRAICTKRAGAHPHIAVASIVIERALGFIATPLFALGSMLLLLCLGGLDPRLIPASWLGAGLLLAASVFMWASLSRTLFDFFDAKLLSSFDQRKPVQLIREFHRHYRSYRDARGELALFFLLTLLEQLATVIVFWLVAWSLHVQVSLLYMAAAVPVALLVARIPLSAGGLGVFEGVFVLILTSADVPPHQSLAIAVVCRVLQIVAWLPWWLAYVASRGGTVYPPSEPAGQSTPPT